MITLEEFKKKHSDKCRLIGLDLGSKRIGVSICDEKQLIATPLKTINRNTLNELISELKVIIDENNIKGIIIGKLTDGTRFLANTERDPDVLEKMCKRDMLNASGFVSNDGKRNIFKPN